MSELRVPAIFALAGFGLTAALLIDPSPYLTAAFAFLAQPLFLIAGVLFLRHVYLELRRSRVR